jgi:hypothetical protein
MSPQENLNMLVAKLDDWRGTMINQVATIVSKTNTNLIMEWKWGVPMWTYNNKLILATSAFKSHVKINFFAGAYLEDPDEFFTSGLDSKEHRSINIAQDTELPTKQLIAMIDRAVKYCNR